MRLILLAFLTFGTGGAWASENVQFSPEEIHKFLCVARLADPREKAGPDVQVRVLYQRVVEVTSDVSKVAAQGEAIQSYCVSGAGDDIRFRLVECQIADRVKKNPAGFVKEVRQAYESFKTYAYESRIAEIWKAREKSGINDQIRDKARAVRAKCMKREPLENQETIQPKSGVAG